MAQLKRRGVAAGVDHPPGFAVPAMGLPDDSRAAGPEWVAFAEFALNAIIAAAKLALSRRPPAAVEFASEFWPVSRGRLIRARGYVSRDFSGRVDAWRVGLSRSSRASRVPHGQSM